MEPLDPTPSQGLLLTITLKPTLRNLLGSNDLPLTLLRLTDRKGCTTTMYLVRWIKDAQTIVQYLC